MTRAALLPHVRITLVHAEHSRPHNYRVERAKSMRSIDELISGALMRLSRATGALHLGGVVLMH
jgi:hypothetical protein